MAHTADTWSPGAYEWFRDFRLRPALDLLHGVGPVPAGAVVDLGCGSGVVAPALAERFGAARLCGVDQSAPMLDKAAQTDSYARLHRANIATWAPEVARALIFANAVLHWRPDHEGLLPCLAEALVPGGWLAVQMPGQNDAPSHRLWRDLTGTPGAAGTGSAEDHLRWFGPLGAFRIWQTSYHQMLTAALDRHPVAAFTESRHGCPFLEAAAEPHALAATKSVSA